MTHTWGLKGHTPVIQQSFTWQQMSAIVGLSWWRFYFRLFDGAVKSEQTIEFLSMLKRQIDRKLLIVWDGIGTQESRRVRRSLEQQDGRIAIALLPPCAPELNPVEEISAYLKKHEIANLAHLAEVSDFARRRLKSIQRWTRLLAPGRTRVLRRQAVAGVSITGPFANAKLRRKHDVLETNVGLSAGPTTVADIQDV